MIINEDYLRDYPLARLSDVLEFAAVDYKDAFEAVWALSQRSAPEGVDEDEWRELIRLYQLATKFAVGASFLIRPPRLQDPDLSTPEWLANEARRHAELIESTLPILQEQYPNEDWAAIMEPHQPGDPRVKDGFFRICLELEAHQRFSVSPDVMATRMLKLFQLMVRDANEFVRAYLSRVAECYVRGMDTELAVMARAVLERALRDERLARPLVDGLSLVHSRAIDPEALESQKLKELINAAAAGGVLEGDAFLSADQIRKVGNAAAHGDPSAWAEIPDGYGPDAILQDLVTVLSAMNEAMGGQRR